MFDFSQLPTVSSRNIAIHVKPAAERAIKSGHPWLFENSIRKQSRTGNAGDITVIFDKKNQFLAVGIYDPASLIRVKILHHSSSARVNSDFFRDKLSQAIALRESLNQSNTTGYRLVYGEGDSLPGLIIDRYADVLVIKLYSLAWLPHLEAIIDNINALLPEKTLVLRLSRILQESETFGLYDGMIIQGELADNRITFEENGLILQADVVDGHKTGFFFDQRDNRFRVRQLAEGKTVLDVFSYNGGFSVNAAAGGAKSVTSLDISSPALSSAIDNMKLNQNNSKVANCEHHTLVADAFVGLKQLAREKRSFDMLIVDPPTFASSQQQVEGALQAYENLIYLALDVLKPGGTLVMASCSSRIPAEKFFDLVDLIAMRAGRPLKEIERTQHGIDHPITFPYGAYLKCLFAKA